MQLDILRAIQKISSPLLDIIMEGVTLFGEEMIIMAVFCAIYWCIDKRLGRFIAVSLGLSLCLNGVIKDFFKVERPIGAEGIVSRRIETATGYSFPSGHTQTSTAFWGGIAVMVKCPWRKAACAALVLLVGFSRLYLGVHYPSDVIGGIVAGLICVLLVYFIKPLRFGKTVVSMLCLIAVITALLTGESSDTLKGAGALFGIISGLYFEQKVVNFNTNGIAISKKFMRYALALAVVGVCYIAPSLLLPETTHIDFARYAFLTFVVTGLCPYIFKRLRI